MSRKVLLLKVNVWYVWGLKGPGVPEDGGSDEQAVGGHQSGRGHQDPRGPHRLLSPRPARNWVSRACRT